MIYIRETLGSILNRPGGVPFLKSFPTMVGLPAFIHSEAALQNLKFQTSKTPSCKQCNVWNGKGLERLTFQDFIIPVGKVDLCLGIRQYVILYKFRGYVISGNAMTFLKLFFSPSDLILQQFLWGIRHLCTCI